jgi:hypothetical protein
VVKVINNILKFNGKKNISAVWMTKEEGVEEGKDENDIKLACNKFSAKFKL